jgi:hypothetical protein
MNATNLVGFAQWADFELIHDRGSVLVNSSILSAVSPVIKSSLSSPDSPRVFVFGNSCPSWRDSTSDFLNFLFGGDLLLTDDNVPFLYFLAARLEIQPLLVAIEVFFRNHGGFVWVVATIQDFRAAGLPLRALYPTFAINFEAFLEYGYLWDFSGDTIGDILSHPMFRVSWAESVLRFLLDRYTVDPIGFGRALSLAANRYFSPFVLQLLEKCPSFDFREIRENLVEYLSRMGEPSAYAGEVNVYYINGRYDGVIGAIAAGRFRYGPEFKITGSAPSGPKYGPDNLCSFATDKYFCAKGGEKGWVTIEFVGLQLHLTVYALKAVPHATLETAPSNWTLEGSNDGAIWSELHSILHDRLLGSAGIGVYRLPKAVEGYRFFRFSHGRHDAKSHKFALAGIELFGIAREWPRSGDSAEAPEAATGDVW